MADIDVVPKRRASVWLWIVLAVVVLVVLWMLMGRTDSTPRTGRISAPAPLFVADAPEIGGNYV